MAYIKSQLSEDLAKKILGNQAQAAEYLLVLSGIKPELNIPTKTVLRGNKSGQKILDLKNNNVWKIVVNSWDYEIGLKIIRQLFLKSNKYKNGQEANNAIKLLRVEWEKLNLGSIDWPFSQGDFDGFVQRVNAELSNGSTKDEKVKLAAVKYRRIKEINTYRNDYIEALIFHKNNQIMPTLNHRRGVDFFIDGVSYDQKVAKSPTNQFKKQYGQNWHQKAIANPELVASYLYKHQDEGRFGADPRLLVVYLDEDVTVERIQNIIETTDLKDPSEITFTYRHKVQGDKTYRVPCFIILLHN